jgi:dTDP-4-amino-4,6-dideoxygalactose transaminase
MDGLLGLAKEFGLKIIEDCAQAHGAEYKGRRVGAIGDAGTFSFYPGKNLGAYGDGGAMTTNSEAVAKKARMIANHGRTGKYDHIFEGRNSRLDGLQAAILSVKLKYLDTWIARRIEVADFYRKSLGGLKDVVLPPCETWAKHVYHLFVVRVADREGLKKHLEGKGVQTGVHYPIALPKLKAYDYLGQGTEKMRANEFDSALLSLPIGEHLGRDELKVVADAVASFYR